MTSILYTQDEILARIPSDQSTEHVFAQQGSPLNPSLVYAAESRLGVSLPKSYLDLIGAQNGGYLRDDVEFEGVDGFLTAIAGIGYARGIDSDEGIGGLAMSRTWEYPADMVWLDGDGHTGFFLDYRTCGPEGEPRVVWLDSEGGEGVFVPVAPDFASLVRLIEAYRPPKE